jgi:lipopolysaccharide export LptBFGC system permease protein LptF
VIVGRYFLREILTPWLVAVALFGHLVVFGELLKISDAVTGFGIGAADLAKAIIFSLPPLFGLLIPITFLFAALLAMGRWSHDREWIGLQALGYRPYQLFILPTILGSILGLITMLLLLFGEPWGLKGLQEIAARGAQQALAQGIQAKTFTSWVPGVTFYAERKAEKHYEGVLLADERQSEQPLVVSAREARIVPSVKSEWIVFELLDGTFVLQSRDGQKRRVVSFKKSRYVLNVGSLVGRKLGNITPAQALYPAQLLEKIEQAKQNPSRAGYHALLTITLHRKIALGVATLVFGLLAVTLGLWSRDGASARGFLVCALIVVGYYYLGRGLELSARAGHFSALWAAWSPNLVGFCLWLVLNRFAFGAAR